MKDHYQACYFFDTYMSAVLHQFKLMPPHRHGVLQLSVSLDGMPHKVGVDKDSMSLGHIHLVKSNQQHVFSGELGYQVIVWVAPESSLGHQLTRCYLQDQSLAILSPDLLDNLPIDELVNAYHERWSGDRFRPLCEMLMAKLSQQIPQTNIAMHPSIRKSVKIIRNLAIKKISAAELSSMVGLSESRLMHLFKEYMGTPLRPYLQWLRCLDALAASLNDGQSLTEAAIGAGFTDGAHFNRVMYQFYGSAPSTFVQANYRLEFCLRDIDDVENGHVWST